MPTSDGHRNGPLGAAEHEGAAHCHVGSLATGILHSAHLGRLMSRLEHRSDTLCTLHDGMYVHHQGQHRVPYSSRATTACEEADTRQVCTI
jgi:hypothetical protein